MTKSFFNFPSWNVTSHGFGTGELNELTMPQLLKQTPQAKIMSDLVAEIEERDVSSLEKAIELILKSLEVWNFADEDVHNIESAIVSVLSVWFVRHVII